MRRTKRGGWPYSQPPGVPFEINRDSPLARGLQGWWPSLASRGALILRDLTLGANLSATGTPAWRAAPTRGQVVRLDDTNTDYYSGSRRPAMDITGNLDYEVALWFRVNAWAADWQSPILCGTKTDIWGATNGWSINLYRGDAHQHVHFGGHPGPSYCGSAATTSFSIGDWILVHGWRQLSDSNIYIAFNGGASLHNAWLGNPTDAATMYVGSALAANASLDWDFGGLLFWDRLLTTSERWRLYNRETRWELYKPLIRRWLGWAPTGAAPVTVELNALTLTSSTPSLTQTSGAVSVECDALSLTGSAENLTLTTPVTISLDALSLSGSVPSLTQVSGAASVECDALTLASSAEALTVTTGVTIELNALTLAGSVGALTWTGAVTIACDVLSLASSVETLTVTTGISITLDALTLAGSVEDLTQVPGAVTIAADALSLTSTAGSLTWTGVTSLAMDALTLTGAPQSLTVVPGVASVILDTLTLTGTVPSLTVTTTGILKVDASLSIAAVTTARLNYVVAMIAQLDYAIVTSAASVIHTRD